MPKFISDEEMAKIDQPKAGFISDEQMEGMEKPSVGQSALRGAAQGVSFGFSDEIAGLAETAKDIAEGKAKSADFPTVYKKHTNESRALYDAAEKENQKAFLGGQVAGGVATAFVPGMGLAKGATLATNAGKAALLGGVQGAGLSKAAPTESPEELKKFGKDVLGGAAIGGAVQGLGQKAAQSLPKYLERVAEARAFKASTGQNKKAFKEALKTGQVSIDGEDISSIRGRDLLSKDEAGPPVVGFTSRVEDIAPKAGAKKEFFGGKIGEVGAEIDKSVPQAVSGKNISQNILDYAASVPETPKNKAIVDNLIKEAEFFEKKGGMSFKEGQELKGTYVFKPTDSTTQTLGQDATNATRRAVSKELEEAASRIADAPSTPESTRELLKRYKDYKGKYQSYIGAEKTATDKSVSNLSNRFASPSDYGVGGTAFLGSMVAGHSGPGAALYAAGAGYANKLARERGSAFVARSADAVANIMNATPEVLGKYAPLLSEAARRGGPSFAVTHQLLMAKDPGYQRMVDQLTQGERNEVERPVHSD